ncbi:FG-GAP-like repeat-containing protein [Amycolatopsis sp.]|uniref:FG-GAP-like repeat-containing protein n=1 Tax=Amycolatopsis sp. TaxID=37632 RepID=UPI002E001728|nr:FG-GAP-like repeat-containing protein [Amycolatopsis sp.]
MIRRHGSFLRRLLPVATATALLAGLMGTAPAQAAGDIDLCVSVGRTAGFTGENFVVAVAVAMAESRCDPAARGVNPGHSIDRGLWQINDYYHPDVSDTCAYNAQCNANAAFRISDGGTDWSPWSTYKSGSYKKFLTQARAAIGVSPPPVRAAKSINGDRYDDAIGVDSGGVAWVYHGKSTGGFGAAVRLGPGWGGFDRIAISDADADGWADLFATDGNTLYYWHNRGDGSFTPVVTVGAGWAAIEYLSFADVNGDNKADILARDGGNMYVYIGRGNGGFAVRDAVGPGWAGLLRHTGGDADADGDGDIWATNSAGDLFYWKRNGESYDTAVEVGSGWNGFRQLTTMDINGDNRADMIAIRASDNTLWRWSGEGTGRFGQGVQIGSGWTGFILAAY